MAGGVAYLDFLEQNDILNHVTNLGNHMLKSLNELEEQSKVMGEVRGKGLMLGIDLVYDKKTKNPAPDIANKLRKEALKKGVIIEIGGHYHNVARILPPLVLTEELADRGLDILGEALHSIEQNM
jgi:diaminobutyrate-2-oxoglutarate transaminase